MHRRSGVLLSLCHRTENPRGSRPALRAGVERRPWYPSTQWSQRCSNREREASQGGGCVVRPDHKVFMCARSAATVMKEEGRRHEPYVTSNTHHAPPTTVWAAIAHTKHRGSSSSLRAVLFLRSCSRIRKEKALWRRRGGLVTQLITMEHVRIESPPQAHSKPKV